MISKNKPIGNNLTIIFICGFIFLVIILVITKIWVTENARLNAKIYPNVYIDKINVGHKTKDEVIKLFSNQSNQLNKINVEILYLGDPIATFSARQLLLRFNTTSIADQALLIGRSNHWPSKIFQQATTLLNLKKFSFTRKVEYDKQVIKEYINNIYDQYSYPAKNALFSFENGRVTNFRKETPGLEILKDKFEKDAQEIINSLNSKIQDIAIDINSKVVNPEISLAKANTFGIEEMIGQGKSNYTHSIPERIHNLTLASSKFNGVLIPRNKVFSFNDTVGDISSLTGYKPAYIIKSGKTVLGDGGGVCQVSTTLFRASLNTGLPIIERHAHAYRVGYYENDSQPGFDATVFSPTTDLKIKNDTPTDILIQVEVDQENMVLTFKLYGKKDGRKVQISPVNVYDIQPPPPAVYQDDPTLKKGQQKQIDFAAWGAKATFTYKIIYNNGVIEDDKIYSSYTPWHAVYLNGTAD